MLSKRVLSLQNDLVKKPTVMDTITGRDNSSVHIQILMLFSLCCLISTH